MGSLTKFGVPVAGATSTVLMPKLSYRFRVEFNGMGGQTNANSLTHQIQSVTRPTISHEPITLDVYNSRVYLAGKHTWEPITIVVRDDIEGGVISLVDKQMQNQVDHHEQAAPRAGAQYKFTTKIETLDGTNAGSEPGILDTWELSGCFFTNVSFGENDYSNSAPATVTMTIQYDNAKHTDEADTNLLNSQSISDTSLATSTAGNS